MKKKIVSYDPANGEIVGEVQATGIEEIDSMVEQARVAAMGWKKMRVDERVDLLKKAYGCVEPHINEIAVLLSREMGKDIRRATGEVHGSAFGGPYIARSAMDALATRHTGGGTRVEYKPLGVAAVISPWNYPVAMANNLIVPALVAGNTVVFKPSEETPLVGQAFFERLNEVLPEHVLQIVHGDEEQGRTLVESNVNIIAFTQPNASI